MNAAVVQAEHNLPRIRQVWTTYRMLGYLVRRLSARIDVERRGQDDESASVTLFTITGAVRITARPGLDDDQITVEPPPDSVLHEDIMWMQPEQLAIRYERERELAEAAMDRLEATRQEMIKRGLAV
jgi:hypothetical protein